MRKLLILFSLLFSFTVFAGNAVIFEGDRVKALKNAINLFDDAYVLTGTDDPTSVAKDAPRGSIYLRDTGAAGELYVKQDDGSSTNWTVASLVPSNDPDAIHDNIAAEISAITDKATPATGDHMIIEDSAAADAKKSMELGNLLDSALVNDQDAIHDDVASEISAITAKATPVGADFALIEDSAAGNAKKSVTLTNLLDNAVVNDQSAIHDDVAGEITAIADKATPVGGDHVVIEDSAAANAKKSVELNNLLDNAIVNDQDAIHDNVGAEISAIADKATPAAGDHIIAEDSAAADAKVSIEMSNLLDNALVNDQDAVHDNVAAEISAVTDKATPATGDHMLIEDSAAADAKKSMELGNLLDSALVNDQAAIHDDVAGEITAIAAKTVPVSADEFLMEDSAAADAKKAITAGNLLDNALVNDQDAIHDNVAGEIVAITDKAVPAAGDHMVIEDSADSNNKKSMELDNLLDSALVNDQSAIHDNVASEISAITAKATPTTSDFLLIEDAADSNNKKRITIGDLPASGGSGNYANNSDTDKYLFSIEVQYSAGTPSTATGGDPESMVSSYTDSGTGDVTINLNSVCTSTPFCTCSAEQGGLICSQRRQSSSSTAIRVIHTGHTGSVQDPDYFQVRCECDQ